MSFLLSDGTLDTMADIFAPARKRKAGDGGGRPGQGKPFDASGIWMAMASPVGGARHAVSPRVAAFGSGGHASQSANAISTLSRTARRAPEVLVRVSGSQKGGGHVLANFTYIARLGHGEDKQVDLFTSEKEVLTDGAAMRELAAHWHDHEMSGDDRRKGATSISMVLSMPAGTDPEILRETSIAFAEQEMVNRFWVAALHVDRDHPHVHLTIARRDHDGVRFYPTRGDLFRYRQIFAEKLRDRGIEANATPARARGVEPRNEPIAIRKLRDKGTIMRLDERRSELARAIIEKAREDASLVRASADQSFTKRVYQRSISELAGSPDPEHRAVARSLAAFIDAMPPPATRLSELAAEMAREGPAPSDVVDPVKAALARARQALEAQASIPDGPGRPVGESPAEGLATRIQRMLDEANKAREAPAMSPPAQSAEEIGRQIDEQHRQFERDRARDRDRKGPSR